MFRLELLPCIMVICSASTAHAQLGGLVDRVKERVERRVEKKGEEAAEKAAEQALTPKKGAPAKDPKADQAAQVNPSNAQKAPDEKVAGGATSAPPEVYGNRFDFVPGDKVVVYDDFADTDAGEYPARWTMKDGGGNPVEVVRIGARRFLKARYQNESQDSSRHWLRYAPQGDMPERFTIELDADVGGPFSVLFSNHRNMGGQEIRFGWERHEVSTENAEGKLPVREGVQHVSIAVAGTQVKVYVAGERVAIDSDGVVRPIARIGVEFLYTSGEAGDHQMFTGFRLAEGGTST